MTTVRPWTLGDTRRVNIQSAQQYMCELGDLDLDLTDLSEKGLAWTLEDDGEVLACGGLVPVWNGRFNAWLIVSKNAGRRMTTFYRSIESIMGDLEYRRIEAFVDVGFDAGIRLVKMLGFELESYKRAYRPDGADMLEFVRIKQ